MDGNMKGYITTGLIALCLVLGAVGLFGSSWLTMSEYADADTGTPAMEGHASLSTTYMEIDGVECTSEFVEVMGGECDGDAFAMSYSDQCDDTDDEEVCEASTAGTVGTIGLWIGLILSLVMVLMAVLPMAGVNALNDMMGNLPEMCVTVMNWAAGGMVLAGALLWLLLLPDTQDADLGMSFYLTIVAGLMGLGATGMNTFMADE